MDALTLIILVVAALALLRGSLRPTPQIIYVEPAPAEPAGGFGCLLAGAMFLALLVLTGIVKI